MLTLVQLKDVNGEPRFLIDLPGPLRIGDPISFRLKLDRQNGGRFEVLEVDTRFRVTAVGIDSATVPRRQVLAVESTGVAPTWRAVKKPLSEARRLPPARFPREAI